MATDKWWTGRGMGQVVSVARDGDEGRYLVTLLMTPTQASAANVELSLAANVGVEVLFHKGDAFYDALALAYGIKE